MDERHEDRLTTADMAAAGTGATMEREFTRDVELRPGSPQSVRNVAARAEVAPLFGEGDTGELRSRWEEIQSMFVDEPRRSVERADELVADVMRRLAEMFADERSELETQWTRGDDVSTEDLRVALQRYRSFFDRLLSI